MARITYSPGEHLFQRPCPAWKRAMDIVGSLVAILLTAPLMLLIMIAVKCSSQGPAVFRQERAGQGGRPFTFYKFRTMVVDAEEQKYELLRFNERDGPAFKMTNDPRITRVGRFLRRWSLDELPQFFNVLKGDMSLVGPRPLPCAEAGRQDLWHNRRLEVKPGITCLWQIYARGSSSFDGWARLDIEYVDNLSFWLDVKLLLLTLPAVLTKRGAY